MKIAIDLSVLQTEHRFRGIGSVVVNFVNHLSDKMKKENSFVFFVERKDEALAYEWLKLDGINFETRYLTTRHYSQLPGKLSLLTKLYYKIIGFIEYYTGDPRLSRKQLVDIDRYIQFHQSQKLPIGARKNTILILYDIIPYILEFDYLWSYSTARHHDGSYKNSLKCAFLRQQYISRIKINCRRAKTLIAISQHTKNDFVKYIGVNENKIKVVLLGVDHNNKYTEVKGQNLDLHAYKTTLWGSVKYRVDLTVKPFVLFIGGVDSRRRMIELLAAYNNLRARGTDLSLVLSGDTMDGLENIKNEQMKKYLRNNLSYSDDIHLMGYVTNDERDWLYRNALAFVFPSMYEGFGLPVLEAMSHSSPVITYKNTSIVEVGGESVLYVNGYAEIVDAIQKLIDNPSRGKALSKKGLARSSKFTWDKTVNTIIEILKQS